jgi:hypothetical protein
VWFDDPARDIRIKVRDLRREKDGTLHVRVRANAALHGERERQRWRLGVKRLGIVTRADAVVAVDLDCKVASSLDVSRLPPQLRFDAQVTDVRLGLEEFDLLQVGKLLAGEEARLFGNEFKGVLEGLLRTQEPAIKEFANREIKKTLAKGSAGLIGELLKGKGVGPPTAKE